MPIPGAPAAATPPSPGFRPGFRVLRNLAAAGALVLAVLPLLGEHERTVREAEMTVWLGQNGLVAPPELSREPDPGRIELRAARAALDAELDAARHGTAASLDAETRRQISMRMAAAARLAGSALQERPAAWDAALVLGAATYLGWSLGHDPRLFTAAPRWEAPLEAALRLAPDRPEPARFLAAAYLEVWQALSPARRERARQLLTTAFADPATLATLVGPWLTIAGSRDEAFALLPAEPEAWKKIEEIYARQHDWAGFCAAHRRREAALFAQLSRHLAEAGERSARGDFAGARDLYLEVASQAPPGRRYLDLVRDALAHCPPGPVDRKTAERLAGHLSWSLERCLLASCPLPERTIERLAGFCRGLAPPREAMAALVAGDLTHAVKMEQGDEALETEAWAPYLLLKARTLSERGRSEDAVATLAPIHRSWLARPGYWQIRAGLARAAGDTAATAEATRELSRLAAREWPAAAWDFRGGVARLEMLTAQPATGIRLRFDVVPKDGAAVEVRLDDLTLGTFPATAGGTLALALAAPLAPGLHLVEVESAAGGDVLPGGVALADGGEGGKDGSPAGEMR